MQLYFYARAHASKHFDDFNDNKHWAAHLINYSLRIPRFQLTASITSKSVLKILKMESVRKMILRNHFAARLQVCIYQQRIIKFGFAYKTKKVQHLLPKIWEMLSLGQKTSDLWLGRAGLVVLSSGTLGLTNQLVLLGESPICPGSPWKFREVFLSSFVFFFCFFLCFSYLGVSCFFTVLFALLFEWVLVGGLLEAYPPSWQSTARCCLSSTVSFFLCASKASIDFHSAIRFL